MKKINTSPISGAQELLPEQQATFNNLKNKIGEVYHAHGFLSIETPTIDRTAILFAKAGGDTEKQVYKVVKTAEAADGNWRNTAVSMLLDRLKADGAWGDPAEALSARLRATAFALQAIILCIP